MKIETLLTPAEWPALAGRDLGGTACVVLDVLRATSTFVTALHHGAKAIIPVAEISEALALRRQQPELLLAGERGGGRISAALAGGIDFDFGNSPREFISAKVQGQTIVATTTNGTRALRSCAMAATVLAGSFLNLSATAAALRGQGKVLLICAGTGYGPALEDVLAAGALVAWLAAGEKGSPTLTDASRIAWQTFLQRPEDLGAALGGSQNGRRLLAIPELHDDVAYCARRDVFPRAVKLSPDGLLQLG